MQIFPARPRHRVRLDRNVIGHETTSASKEQCSVSPLASQSPHHALRSRQVLLRRPSVYPSTTTICPGGDINSIVCADTAERTGLVIMADTADQPLMGHQPDDDDHHSDEGDAPDASRLLEQNLSQPGLFVWLLTLSAGISGLLFGCKCSFPMPPVICGKINETPQTIPASSLPLWSRSITPSATP